MLYKQFISYGKDMSECRSCLEGTVALLLRGGWLPQGGMSISTVQHPVNLSVTFYLAQAMVKPEPEDLQVEKIDATEFAERTRRIISEAVNA